MQGNVAKTYKFGIIYCGDNQTTEEQMYGNQYASDGFEDFLSLLGQRVVLQGFDKFKGGLDTVSMFDCAVFVLTRRQSDR